MHGLRKNIWILFLFVFHCMLNLYKSYVGIFIAFKKVWFIQNKKKTMDILCMCMVLFCISKNALILYSNFMVCLSLLMMFYIYHLSIAKSQVFNNNIRLYVKPGHLIFRWKRPVSWLYVVFYFEYNEKIHPTTISYFITGLCVTCKSHQNRFSIVYPLEYWR